VSSERPGDELRVEPTASVDADTVWSFFERIGDGDRTFFKEPVLGPETIERWAADETSIRLVALDGDDVVGSVAVIPGVGWSQHVGEMRLVVDPSRRGKGIGSRLAHAALVDAIRAGLTKVSVEVVAEQVSVINLFQGLGFTAEALLEDHVRDATGEVKDLIVMSHKALDAWARLDTIGLGEPLDSSSEPHA
jgi:ribosomal protein S18 acetylase RimI-like enzyme